MSYKTEFQSNNADLQTVLDMVCALPDKVYDCKCTVTISGYTINRVIYTKVTNTGAEFVNITPASTSVTLEDVLCGSSFYFETSAAVNRTAYNCTLDVCAINGMYYSYCAPTNAGGAGTITLTA